MVLSRRDALKTFGAISISGLRSLQAGDQSATLVAIADVVLPAESDRKAAVAAFTSWIDNYAEGADTDHGYGNTRIRALGPSPGRNYAAQIAALDEAARAKGAPSFRAASPADRCRTAAPAQPALPAKPWRRNHPASCRAAGCASFAAAPTWKPASSAWP